MQFNQNWTAIDQVMALLRVRDRDVSSHPEAEAMLNHTFVDLVREAMDQVNAEARAIAMNDPAFAATVQKVAA